MDPTAADRDRGQGRAVIGFAKKNIIANPPETLTAQLWWRGRRGTISAVIKRSRSLELSIGVGAPAKTP